MVIEIDVFQFNEKDFSQSDVVNSLVSNLLKQETLKHKLLLEDEEYTLNNDKINFNANLLPIPNNPDNDNSNLCFLVFHDHLKKDRFIQFQFHNTPNTYTRYIESSGILEVNLELKKVIFKPTNNKNLIKYDIIKGTYTAEADDLTKCFKC